MGPSESAGASPDGNWIKAVLCALRADRVTPVGACSDQRTCQALCPLSVSPTNQSRRGCTHLTAFQTFRNFRNRLSHCLIKPLSLGKPCIQTWPSFACKWTDEKHCREFFLDIAWVKKAERLTAIGRLIGSGVAPVPFERPATPVPLIPLPLTPVPLTPLPLTPVPLTPGLAGSRCHPADGPFCSSNRPNPPINALPPAPVELPDS